MLQALRKLGVPSADQVYSGVGHAFHMATFLPAAKKLWKDTFDFLSEHVPANASRNARVRPFGASRSKRANWLQDKIIDLMAA
jgi:hypothetical protein